VSVVERVGQVNSKAWDGWWAGHVSTFNDRNINASDHYVTAHTQQLKQKQVMIVDRVDG
jgi:hypothetical protein